MYYIEKGTYKMIYGYPVKKVNEYGLMEMKEISIAATPVVLRDISRFLAEAANLLEAGAFSSCSHRHIQSVIHDWDQRFPDKDIIVIPQAGGKDGTIPDDSGQDDSGDDSGVPVQRNLTTDEKGHDFPQNSRIYGVK